MHDPPGIKISTNGRDNMVKQKIKIAINLRKSRTFILKLLDMQDAMKKSKIIK